MKAEIKNIIISVMLTAVTLPFLLVTDLFPFMRFGMFAEPVKFAIQTESFLITYLTSEGKERLFDPEEIGIEPHFFFYLTRNYYYRGESEQLFSKIDQASKIRKVKEWRLKKITMNTANQGPADTMIVARKRYED